MKAGWVEKRLDNIGVTQTGSTPKTSEKENFGDFISFIKPADFNEDGSLNYINDGLSKIGLQKSRCVNAGSVLMVCIGATIGKCGWNDRDVTTNQQVNVLTTFDNVSQKFVYYQMLTEDFQRKVLSNSSQATLPIINKSKWSALTVCIPPTLPEQQRIVTILDEAFDGIATAKANAEKNLHNARALFESHLQSVFTQRGEGWVENALGDVCEFVGGSQPPKSVFEKTETDDNIRLIQIRDYKSDKHIVYIPRTQARRFCNAEEVMIGRYGPPLFQILRGLNGAYNVALMKAVPDESKLTRNFLFYFLKHSSILQYVIYHSERAAGQIGVTKETLQPYPIALPSLSEQQIVVETIMELESETQRLESIYQQKLAALDALKKSLLDQAFTGAL